MARNRVNRVDVAQAEVSRRTKTLTRRGFVPALLAAIGAALVVGLAWLVSRDAPSSGRDPEFMSPALAPTRPAPGATPEGETG